MEDGETEKKTLSCTCKDIKTLQIEGFLSLALKGVTILAIATGIFIGGSLYYKMSHSGPSCNKLAMNKWVNKVSRGNIISIHENKIQSTEGTTSCFGDFERSNGSYVQWKGSITDTDQGFIGWAKIVN